LTEEVTWRGTEFVRGVKQSANFRIFSFNGASIRIFEKWVIDCRQQYSGIINACSVRPRGSVSVGEENDGLRPRVMRPLLFLKLTQRPANFPVLFLLEKWLVVRR
jgi:hypothetical protein